MSGEQDGSRGKVGGGFTGSLNKEHEGCACFFKAEKGRLGKKQSSAGVRKKCQEKKTQRPPGDEETTQNPAVYREVCPRARGGEFTGKGDQ